MTTNTLARRHRWLGALLLVALLAAMLPAQRARAEISTFGLTSEEVDALIYASLDAKAPPWHDSNVIEAAVLSSFVLNQMNVGYRENGAIDSNEIIKQADALQARYVKRLGPKGADPAYRDSLPPRVVAQTMFVAALETPPYKASAEQVYNDWKETDAHFLAADYDFSPETQIVYTTVAEGNILRDARRVLQKEKQLAMAQARAKASKEREQVVAAWDAVMAPLTGVKLGDFLKEGFDIKAFLAAHPEADVPQEIQNAIKPDGSLEININDLDQVTRKALDTINATIDDAQKTAGAIGKPQGELADGMSDAEKRAKAKAIAEARYADNQRKLEAASSAVYIVSTIVSLDNPERGKQIAVVGQSAIQVGEAINGWLLATAGDNTLNSIGSLSTVVMTGNILAAAMNIYSLFAAQQPTPEQIILEEIGKLRQEVNELRTEMHGRFDQIDKELNAIYSAMNDRFNLIDIQLGKITTSLEEIQQSLLNLGIALDRIERNNTEYLDTLGRRPLREAINGALSYKERTGLDMPYQPDFVEFENIFHTWGTVTAFDALSAGPSERNYSDGQVLAELSAAPLDANLNYLNGWLQAHGLQPFSTKRLPSPRDWAFASRAYAQLGMNWPQHLNRIGAARQAAFDAVGKDLEQALANIATIQTPDGPQGNAPLFRGLTNYYQSKLDALDSALEGSEAAYTSEIGRDLKHLVAFDLYGGLDQALPFPHQPDSFRTITCGNDGIPQGGLATPLNLNKMITNYNRFALADYFGLSPLTACAYATWDYVDPSCSPKPCDLYGNYRITLTVRSKDTIVLARSLISDRRLYNPNVWELVGPNWNRYWRGQFEAMFDTQPAPPLEGGAAAQFGTITTELTNKLAELQRAHNNRVLSELNSGALRAKAVELAGARKLLECFVTLGLPRAAGNDDFLRSLLFSREALIDDQQVALAYTKPTTATVSVAQLLESPRAKLIQTAQKREDALSTLLTDYLGAVSTETYREDMALIAGARFDLQLARSFADPSLPLPGGSQVIYLPLVQKP